MSNEGNTSTMDNACECHSTSKLHGKTIYITAKVQQKYVYLSVLLFS
jgi:hypothetical protein